MHLSDLWFIAIAVLWAGYFTLEGFDFGVGILLPVLGRDSTQRRIMINTIGPVWDGNEVWLLTAGGATFAAFPSWYAAMFSAFYLPLLIVLVALIIRGVAFEYRGKRDSARWRNCWDAAIFLGSLVPALLWGVAFGNVLRGIPLNAAHNFTGNFFTFLNPYSLLAGLTTLALFTLHGALFLALKTTGDLRGRANKTAAAAALAAIAAGGGFLAWTEASHRAGGWHGTGIASVALAALAATALIASAGANRVKREGLAFAASAGAIAAATAALVIAAAQLIATAIAGTFAGDATLTTLRTTVIVLAVVVAARAVTSWAAEATAHRASAAATSELRRRLLTHAVRLGPSWQRTRSTARLTELAIGGIDALDGYFTGYLPKLILAALVPLAVLVRIAAADPVSGITVAATLPLVPVFGALIGMTAGRQAQRRWQALGTLAHHFFDVTAGLPTLKVFGRAKAQKESIEKVTGEYRRATLATLRLAFLSGLALELVATMSVALVATETGLRLAYGHLDLRTGLLVLILVPEAYLPLRAVGAQFPLHRRRPGRRGRSVRRARDAGAAGRHGTRTGPARDHRARRDCQPRQPAGPRPRPGVPDRKARPGHRAGRAERLRQVHADRRAARLHPPVAGHGDRRRPGSGELRPGRARPCHLAERHRLAPARSPAVHGNGRVQHPARLAGRPGRRRRSRRPRSRP